MAFPLEKDVIWSILFLVMTVAAKKVIEEALALSVSERESVIQQLRNSMPQDSETISQEEWDEAWKKELNARIEEMESDEDAIVSLDEVLADLEKPIRKS